MSKLASSRQSPENKAEHTVLSLELEKLYADLADYWQQRSKTHWMREGDRNTAFFHAKATKRSQTNRVEGLLDRTDGMCHTKEGMAEIVVNYF